MNTAIVCSIITAIAGIVVAIFNIRSGNKKIDDIKTDTGDLLKENVKEAVNNVGNIANNNNTLLHGLDKSMSAVMNQSQMLSYLADAEKKREGMQMKELLDRNTFIAQIDKMYIQNQQLGQELSVTRERLKAVEKELETYRSREMPGIEKFKDDEYVNIPSPSKELDHELGL